MMFKDKPGPACFKILPINPVKVSILYIGSKSMGCDCLPGIFATGFPSLFQHG